MLKTRVVFFTLLFYFFIYILGKKKSLLFKVSI